MEYLQYNMRTLVEMMKEEVLNLIINGIPSIQNKIDKLAGMLILVLNLIINGIPSILGTMDGMGL